MRKARRNPGVVGLTCQKREWVECYEDQNLHPQSPHKSLVRYPACVILTEKLGEADGQLACVDIGENRPT